MRTRTLTGRRRVTAMVVVGASLAASLAVVVRRRSRYGRHERLAGGNGSAARVPAVAAARPASGGAPATRPESRPEEPEVTQISGG